MTDLETNLASMADDARLRATLDDIFARGEQIRRRRHRRVAVGAAAAAAVAALATAVTLPAGTPGGLPAADAAAWGPRPVNLPSEDLAAATKVCSTEVGVDASDLKPIAADERGRSTALLYRTDDSLVDCLLERRTNGFVADSYGKQEWQSLPPDTLIEFVLLQYSEQRGDSTTIDDGVAMARVSDDVAAVYLDVDGQLLQAEVEQGVAVFWLPEGMRVRQVDASLLKLFNSDGEELASQSIGESDFAG